MYTMVIMQESCPIETHHEIASRNTRNADSRETCDCWQHIEGHMEFEVPVCTVYTYGALGRLRLTWLTVGFP